MIAIILERVEAVCVTAVKRVTLLCIGWMYLDCTREGVFQFEGDLIN